MFACKKSSIPVPRGVSVRIGDSRIAIFYANESVYAMEDACSHLLIPLYGGRVVDYKGNLCVSCPGHFFKFSLETGECKNGKGDKFKQQIYKTYVIEDDVYILPNHAQV